jgi:superfamily I DNA/RNA helicase
MDDETFPDYRAVRSGGVELTQEKNNLYVAFTRSKRWLYVTWVVTPMNKQFINISEQHILFIIIGNGYLIFKGF